MKLHRSILTMAVPLACCTTPAFGQGDAPGARPGKAGCSPCPQANHPNRVEFGDTP